MTDFYDAWNRTTTAPPSNGAPADGTAYATAALASEVGKVATAVEGTRNDVLNTAAFNLGTLVGAGLLSENDVIGHLANAAHAAGLTNGEAAKTIRSGLSAGMLQPRQVPEPENLEVPEVTVLDEPDIADAVAVYLAEHLPPIDWRALWVDESTEEWIVEPILPARRLIALYSPPKLGKSLLMLEIAAAVATGRDVLGYRVDRARRVLYVDFENDPKGDIRPRLQAMGYDCADLDNLVYLSYPRLSALDSERGSKELLAAVAHHRVEVVIVDTISRAVQGEENENDTWLAFYRHTGLKLKQAGVALARLDHSGKDETRGQRGGSAKSGDVDAVWRLSVVVPDRTFRLDCEAARMPIAEKTLVLHRHTAPRLYHRVDAEGRAAAFRVRVDMVVQALDDAGLSADAGRDKARDVLRDCGVKASTEVVAEAVRIRRGQVINLHLSDFDADS